MIQNYCDNVKRILGSLIPDARSVWRWKSVFAIPASAGKQNRKIFVSLIEKNFENV